AFSLRKASWSQGVLTIKSLNHRYARSGAVLLVACSRAMSYPFLAADASYQTLVIATIGIQVGKFDALRFLSKCYGDERYEAHDSKVNTDSEASTKCLV